MCLLCILKAKIAVKNIYLLKNQQIIIYIGFYDEYMGKIYIKIVKLLQHIVAVCLSTFLRFTYLKSLQTKHLALFC